MIRLKKAAALALCLCLMAGTTVQAREVYKESADYSAVFDAEYYYQAYPDVQESVGHDADKLLAHFLTSGMKEGRVAKADFDVHAYMENNLDLLAVYGVKDLSKYYYHYMEVGKEEGRCATPKKVSADSNEIASFSTSYNTEEDRAVNVELAAQRINGIVVQPGESFSFSNSIMSRTLENGYVVAPSFASGRVVSSVGGGIHSLAVDYVPKGLDSAIVEGMKDLRFRNPYDYPVCIRSSAEDGTLVVGIYKAETKTAPEEMILAGAR